MDLRELCKEVSDSVNNEFSKDITINGIEFTITLATSKEDTILNDYFKDFDEDGIDDITKYDELKKKTISYSLKSIKGTVIPDIVEEEEGKSLDRNLFIFETANEWPTSIIDNLFNAIMDLKKRSRESIDSNVSFDWYEDASLLKGSDDEDLLEDAEKFEKKKAELHEAIEESEIEDSGVKDEEQLA